MLSRKQYERLRDAVNIAETSGWASKGEIQDARTALTEIVYGFIAPGERVPLAPQSEAHIRACARDEMTGLVARVEALEQGRHLDDFAARIKRERLAAYGLGVISDMPTDSLLAEIKRRLGD